MPHVYILAILSTPALLLIKETMNVDLLLNDRAKTDGMSDADRILIGKGMVQVSVCAEFEHSYCSGLVI